MFKQKLTIFTQFCLFIMLTNSCSTFHQKRQQEALRSLNKADILDYTLESLPKQLNSTFDEFDQSISSVVMSALKNKKHKNALLESELFLKATDASYRGEAKMASMLYKHLLTLNPRELKIKKKYAVELIRSGQIAKSLPLIESLVYPKLNDAPLAFVLGGVYTALNKKKNARKIYKSLWNKFRSVDACVFWSKNLLRDKKEKKGLRVLKNCSRKVKNAEFSYLIGQTYLKNKKFYVAQKYFLKALKIDAHFDKAAIAYGLVLESKEQFKMAIKFYQSYLKKNINSYSITSRVVQVMFTNSYGKKIIPFAERLVNLDPDDLNTKVKLGILYTDDKDYNKAKGLFKEILAAAPKSDKVLYYLAALNQQTGDYDEALSFFQNIGSESGLYLDSNIQISNILKSLATKEFQEQKSYGNKYHDFLTFTNEKRNSFKKIALNLVVNLVTFYEGTSDLKNAIAQMESIQNEESFQEDQLFYLASLYDKIKDHDKSDHIIKTILKKSPRNADALNFLGYSYLERNIELDLAYKYLHTANKLKPKNGYILDSLGWYHYKKGDFRKALEYTQEAWKYANQDMIIAKHLALIYQKFKDYSQAKLYYTEALKNCSNLADKEDLILKIGELDRLRLPASSQ